MPKPTNPLLHGTLDVLILKTLSWGPRHGYAIARWLEDTTEDAIQVEEGSLDPAGYRLEEQGVAGHEGGGCGPGRRARISRRPARGRRGSRGDGGGGGRRARAA